MTQREESQKRYRTGKPWGPNKRRRMEAVDQFRAARTQTVPVKTS
jgi:hypothetical protein